jgi:hypothetical protein
LKKLEISVFRECILMEGRTCSCWPPRGAQLNNKLLRPICFLMSSGSYLPDKVDHHVRKPDGL